MSDETAVRIAKRYAAQHARGSTHQAPDEALLAMDLEQAYAVQRELVDIWCHGTRGAVAGYKIALTSRAMQEMVGVDMPCGGALFSADVAPSPATLHHRNYQHLGLEFELCFRLRHALPAKASPYTAAQVREAVAEALPAFELIEDRNASYQQLDARDLVADNAWCAGIVLGQADGSWQDLDLADTPVTLHYNGEQERANTSAALGNPLNALAWVANHQVAQDRPLQAGHLVMTGSTMKTRFPVPGDEARFVVSGLGSVSMKMTA